MIQLNFFKRATFILHAAAKLLVTLIMIKTAMAVPVSAEESRYHPGVRYTTGSYQYAGWEKTLIDGNPNLKHWTWASMTGYTQGYKKLATGSDAMGRPLKKPGQVYLKPIHISPMAYAKPKIVVEQSANRVTSTALAGKIKPADSSQKELPAKSYGYSYANSADHFSASNLSGKYQAVEKKVAGKILK